MPTRSNSKNRCAGCQMYKPICICGVATQLKPELQQVETRLIVLMHVHEVKLTTNTAKLATMILPRAEIRVRGRKDTPISTEGFAGEDGRRPLLIFPSDEAQTLTPQWMSANPGPYTLIVPDGSWRQAKRITEREKSLAQVTRIKLPAGPLSKYRLREEPTPESVCTFEAIFRALRLLEGEEHGPERSAKMEWFFDVMVERMLWARGFLKPHEVTGGVPPEAIEAFHIAGRAGGEKSKRLMAEAKARRLALLYGDAE